ncbi:hypothetical protein B0H14DRAFT_3532064 [Mycena olivaceomarginata]|nr:hypothetical protein B0H14DRAFT_3532064 [Mycena olivaceomarginata]
MATHPIESVADVESRAVAEFRVLPTQPHVGAVSRDGLPLATVPGEEGAAAEGVCAFDGRELAVGQEHAGDLDYKYSSIGDLPQYLPTLAFPPSYFHRVIRTGPASTNPVLLQDRVRTETQHSENENENAEKSDGETDEEEREREEGGHSFLFHSLSPSSSSPSAPPPLAFVLVLPQQELQKCPPRPRASQSSTTRPRPRSVSSRDCLPANAEGKTPTDPSPLTTPTPSSTGGTAAPAPAPVVTEQHPALEKKEKKPSFIALLLPRKFLSRSRPTTPGDAGAAGERRRNMERRRRARSASGAAGTGAGNGAATPLEGGATPKGGGEENARTHSARTWGRRAGGRENDIVGIVMLEIASAEDVPWLKNMTRTSFDMDPFVVISFGKTVFRTRVIRHSLNPVWDEKLLFHVRRYEIGYKVRLTAFDWDKLSSNDYISEAAFNDNLRAGSGLAVALPAFGDITAVPGGSGMEARERGIQIPLYAEEESGDHPMKEFKLKLEIGTGGREPVLWESKHSPMITFRAKYQPYSLLRQRFWPQYLKQYDTDDTATISHVEITSMLDSLGSTLTGRCDDLTVEEAFRCLEMEVLCPQKHVLNVNIALAAAASLL